jgi:hypothetical protein
MTFSSQLSDEPLVELWTHTTPGTLSEFSAEALLVDRLEKARTEKPVNLHAGTDDEAGQRIVEEVPRRLLFVEIRR